MQISIGKKVKELYQKAKESGEKVPENMMDWVKEDIEKIETWEHKIVFLDDEIESENERGVHNNIAESFSCLLEQAKQGVFYWMSKKHLPRYLNEIGFRWDHRIPKEKISKNVRRKIVMVSIPVMDMLRRLLSRAFGKQVRRSEKGGILILEPALAGTY